MGDRNNWLVLRALELVKLTKSFGGTVETRWTELIVRRFTTVGCELERFDAEADKTRDPQLLKVEPPMITAQPGL
jgi:hypothetical protein